MSGALSLVAPVALALEAVLLQPIRAIGTIFPDVTVEEQGRDDLIITEHPVEQGAAITDHAYKRPSELVMRVGFSDAQNGPGYSQVAYAELLALQASRIPFEVITGKRVYEDMLIASLDVTTDVASEYVLNCTAHFRQIIIVQTAAASVPPSDQQAMPQQTGSPVTGGNVNPVPASGPLPSTLSSLTGTSVPVDAP